MAYRWSFHPASDGGGAIMFDQPSSRASSHELYVIHPISPRRKERPIATTCLPPCLREYSPSATRVPVRGARRAAFLAAYVPVRGDVADRVELVTTRRNGEGRHVLGSWSWRRDGAEPRFTPTWSPDGTRIAFTLSRRGGGSTLYVIGADGDGLRRLTHPSLDRRAPARPAWGPSGTIAFDMKRPDGVRELYLIRSDGTGLRRLTRSWRRTGAWAPAWSNSMDRLAFVRRDVAGGQTDLWIVDADGSDPRRVAKTHASESEPAWFGG